ncbi:hypothetical protein [Psychroflexus montanilacus]|uniref:hypothetical protein n=1 Tax=Psychroflexus montanilacus TaxID=2873598 RepID=UPI001CCC96DA|nr:hypothetical protein [Psychroflexus montanilacus]MBZ9650623.1 hypothetical protein [Psychroflexus montanilacus]
MDFLDIVLKGYTNKNSREFLDKYFYREFKKAEKDHFFEADEFFKGCQDVIESFRNHLQDKVWERKEMLLKMLETAKNNTITYGDLQGKSIEQKRKETIDYCEKELESETPYSMGGFTFTVHLMSITNGRYLGSLNYYEVENIERDIKLAQLKVLKESFRQLEVKEGNIVAKPINYPVLKEKSRAERIRESLEDFYFFQIELISDLNVDGKTYKNIKQKNNNSILNPSNWEQHKDTFFNQRMETYPESYTREEKIKLELETVEKLTINNIDYKILKDRYVKYLKSAIDTNGTYLNIDNTNINNEHSDNPIQDETHSLADKIETYFTFFLDDCHQKGKPILDNEEDFRNLLRWTTYFFEHNFTVPVISKPIRKVKTNKYITQLAFQILFDELRKDGFHNRTAKHQKLFTLWESIFLDYKGYKEDNFWKVKKKNENGEDYDVRVRKLMGL